MVNHSIELSSIELSPLSHNLEQNFCGVIPLSLKAALADALIAAAGDGLIVIDDTGTIVVFNPAAGLIFGLDSEQMLGQNLSLLFCPETFQRHEDYISRFFSGQGRGVVGTTLELDGWHSDGHPVPLEISLSTTTLEGRQLVLASIRDVTARREAARKNQELMQQLLQSQKMEALGTLTAGIAHDFNTNLQTIIGYASTLLAELAASEPMHEDVERIQVAAEQGKQLIKKLLSFSREAEDRFEVLSLNGVVRDVVSVLRRTLPGEIAIHTQLLPSVRVKGDAIWLQAALMNLCLNARDAMPDGGQIVIQSRTTELDAEEAAPLSLAPGRHAVLAVRDTGVGMSDKVIARIFDPFFSTKPRGKGSGLGLAMVQTTVLKHGGRIQVKSELGQGTTFTVHMPASAAEPAPFRCTPSEIPFILGSGEKVLLVDDEKVLLEMGSRLLKNLGYEPLLAGSGDEAVALLEQEGSLAMVILDVMMDGTSCAETLDRMRQLDSGLKVLLSSGFKQDSHPEELAHRRTEGFLQKPYSIEEFAKAIRGVLDG